MDDINVAKSADLTELRPFWPSDYSGLILGYLMQRPTLVEGCRVLDLGTGSGVLAGAALQLGAAEVVATDLDPAALHLAEGRLRQIAPATKIQLFQGSMWEVLAPEAQFDLVLANLPNFPADQLRADVRAAFWSVGGTDGRKVLDPFLAGLPARLQMGGCAVFTQNRCVGLRMTLERLQAQGFVARVENTALVPVSPDKIMALSQGNHEPEGLVELAGFVFLEVALIVVESEGSEGRQPR